MDTMFEELFKTIEELMAHDDDTVRNILPALEATFSESLRAKDTADTVENILLSLDKEGCSLNDAVETQKQMLDGIAKRILTIRQANPTPAKSELCDIVYSYIESYIALICSTMSTRTHVNLFVELCREKAKLPLRAHETDQGADIFAAEDIDLPAHSFGNMVPTGLKFIIPPGWAVAIRPRSGMSRKTPLRISNSPATIDETYRGEVMVLFDNFGDEPFHISAGDRIAQFILEKNYRADFIQIDNVPSDTERGTGGFGSSGT